VRKIQIVLTAALAMTVLSGCMATRKFVRNEVKTSEDALSADIDKNTGEIRETRDSVDAANKKIAGVDERVSGVDQKVSSVDGKVTDLDSRTTQGMNTLKGDISGVSAKNDATARDLQGLDERFQNRNNYTVALEKTIQFGFDSATLPKDNSVALDEVAQLVMEHPDAIVVLEGRTDSTGNADYNVRLGERRVDAVRRYLAVEKEVPVYKIEDISFGAARPIAPNDSREGRTQNRSVVLKVLVPSMEQAKSAAR
jgi:outer membrane protein OmpA-like peptidoglycan-associated protein